MRFSLAILFLSAAATGVAQDKFLLKADGETDTYKLIEQCGYYAETSSQQTADEFMGHGSYEHISQLWDDELGQYVFAFDIHVDFEEDDGTLITDGNKATLVDRQRNEIKCMSSKPSSVASDGETIHYRWKFMLPEGMLTTKEFCHIHQIKGMGDGAEVAHPVFTLTCRSTSNKQVLQVINVPFEGSANVNLAQLDLKPLLGKWIEADEYVTVGKHGSYRLTLTEVTNGKELLDIDEEDIEVWRDTDDNSTMRGKWGIYRSLGSELSLKEDLRSERLLFADIEAQKVIVDDEEENDTEIGDTETEGDNENDGDTETDGDTEIGDTETDGDIENDGDTETDGDTEPEDGPDVDDAGVYSIFDSPNKYDDAFYDLYGRKVLKPTRGIYIRKGEKIFVK